MAWRVVEGAIGVMAMLKRERAVSQLDCGIVLSQWKCAAVLQSDILDINEIFRDLGTLVHEQGEVVGEA